MLLLNPEHLPRQARDKHTGNVEHRDTISAGANFSVANGTSGQPTGDWAAELGAGFAGGSISGYFFADWYKETHRVARVLKPSAAAAGDGDGGGLTVLKCEASSRYGFCEQLDLPKIGGCASGAPGRFVATGWLSEVDAPGEYHFDQQASVLYVYPPEGKVRKNTFLCANLCIPAPVNISMTTCQIQTGWSPRSERSFER